MWLGDRAGGCQASLTESRCPPGKWVETVGGSCDDRLSRERGGRVQAAVWAVDVVARQRQEALRQEMARCRARQRRQRAPWRVRTGWALVEVGLRLAVGGGAEEPPGLRELLR